MVAFGCCRISPLFFAVIVWGSCLTAAALAQEKPAAPLTLQPNDRVVLVGSAFVERMNERGYFESVLYATHPDVAFSVRNLGWSGDDVWGDARAVFGSRADGFHRLVKDTLETKPTVLILCYGENEAFAGAAGLAEFRQGYEQLLQALAPSQARVVMVAPRQHENLGPPLPDPANYNASLAVYRDSIREIATAKGHAFVDLGDALLTAGNPPAQPLTSNGVHLSGYGNWKLAEEFVRRLTGKTLDWDVTLNLNEIKTGEQNLGAFIFTAKDSTLPIPSLATQWLPNAKTSPVEPRRFKVTGLAAGKYELRIDSQAVGTYTQEELAKGIEFVNPSAQKGADKLRELIVKKDELYFHRYRPQNETYLFLFRKHEQGNNAVEIPQFDPLVEQIDQALQTAKEPIQYTVELKSLPSEK